MKHGGTMLVCVMSSLAFCGTASAIPVNSADTSDNPYQSIVDRNVFSLKPPPPTADPAEANKPTALKITLTGITTILGNKRVLIKTAPPPGKPGAEPKTDQSYILTEGQREGDIEVLEIDEKLGSVKVNNAGTVQTLTFEKDGAKLPSTPAPAAPGMPGAPAAIPGLPVAHPASQPASLSPSTPSFQLPTRVPRLPNAGPTSTGVAPTSSGVGFAQPGGTPAYGTPGFLPGNTMTPVLPGTTVPGMQTTTPIPGGISGLSAEEQAIMIEANRERGGAEAALLPPTVLSPKPAQPGAPGQTGTTPSFPPIPGRPPGPY